ncbi:MAG: SUMF1/EgtB/PvdO family nonheme iron enzyme, partial [Anaerolinea sp.]|nr:SUMF1/EgtB/PvdO family nonheme iron enzyme [Anaerolinea sp.]
CKQIVDHLSGYSVWYDNMLVAIEEWWPQIERMIDRCHVFINLVSYAWLKSDYCQEEFEIARSWNKVIINVLIEPMADDDLPESVRDQHYIDMSMGLTTTNLAKLHEALIHAQRWLEQNDFAAKVEELAVPIAKARRPIVQPKRDPIDSLKQAARFLNNQQFEDALRELHRLGQIGPDQNPWLYNRVQTYKDAAERGLAQQQKRDEIKRRNRLYEFIVEELRGRETRAHGIEDFKQFHRRYPDYDPLNIAPRLFKNGRSPGDVRPVVVSTSIPMLEFRHIPGGPIRLKIGQGSLTGDFTEVTVPDFHMATYPFTNEQALLWYNDPNGYNNLDWWSFSPFALEWRRMHPAPGPMKPGFNGPLQPRTEVSWYEAMAITAWLSARLGYRVTLPTRAQRVRAARGDSARPFAWIGDFSIDYANTQDSRLQMTTDVTTYELGISAFSGVYDLCGNSWEWCRDNADGVVDLKANHNRVIHGGSFISPTERAKLDFFFAIPPANAANSIGFRVVVETSNGDRH